MGANLVLSPKPDAETLPAEVYGKLAARYPDVPPLPWLYAVGRVNEQEVIYGGTELESLAALNLGWRAFESLEPKGSAENLAAFLHRKQRTLAEKEAPWLLAGEKAAAHFGWQTGQPVRLEYGNNAVSLPLIGMVSAGGSEDSQLFLPLSVLQELTGHQGELSLIELAVPGSAAQVESWRRELATAMPEVEVRPIRQVVESEARVVMKVRGLMFGLTGLVLGIVILSVMTTVSGLVLDRQSEIGLMKALGGGDRAISSLFAAETACLALGAGLVGYGIGFGLSQWAAQRIFQSSLQWHWEVLPAVILVTLAVALVATAFPVHLVRRLNPAVVLKGA